MKNRVVLITVMLFMGIALSVFGGLVLGQSMEEPITQEELVRQVLETAEGNKLVTMRRVQLAPGAAVSEEPTAEHPAEEFVYILEGSAALTREGEEPITFNAGQAWHNDFERPHALANASESEPLTALVVWVGEEGEF